MSPTLWPTPGALPLPVPTVPNMPSQDPPRKHFTMIRGFHLADFLTLGNAACGVAGVLSIISSTVAPSWSAAFMWRLVPGAYICVYDASKAMLASSANFLSRRFPGVNGRTTNHERFGPNGVYIVERVPRDVPLPGGAHTITHRSLCPLHFRDDASRLRLLLLGYLRQDCTCESIRAMPSLIPSAIHRASLQLRALGGCVFAYHPSLRFVQAALIATQMSSTVLQ